MEGVESTHQGLGRRRVQDSYSWEESCGRLGPFHSVPAPFLLQLLEYLSAPHTASPRASTKQAGEPMRLPPPHQAAQRKAEHLLPPPSSPLTAAQQSWGPTWKAVKWHFLCLCSFHTRLYRSAILPILPHPKIPRDPGLPSHFNTAPDLRGFPQGKKQGGNSGIYFPLSVSRAGAGASGTPHVAVPWQSP